MQCCHCKSYDTKRHGKGRYKCKHCGRTFSEYAKSPFFRYRHADFQIKFAVTLYIFMPTLFVRMLFALFFREYISSKSILAWHKKFHPLFFGCMTIPIPTNKRVRLFGDEKFIIVNGERGYWWNIRDALGNLYACIVTMKRDLTSAKQAAKLAKNKLNLFGSICEMFVSDKLQAYIKAHRLFGRQCKHIQTGIRGRLMQTSNNIELITNNYSESLNSLLDKFLAKYSYSFPSLDAANDAARTFQTLIDLKQDFKAQVEHRETSHAGICELQMAEVLTH